MIGFFVVSAAFAYTDRQILPLFIEPVRADLHITDVQFSLLTGFAFSIFYCLCGVPIGRLADTFSRKAILISGLAVWSLATVATGFCRSFGQVFLMRMTVGVGEATASPSSLSMATDMFYGRALGRAISISTLGASMGAGAALVLGGLLANAVGKARFVTLPLAGPVHPWQFVFIALGAPGLVLAPIMWVFMREPQRSRLIANASGAAAKPTFVGMLTFMGRHKAAVWLYYAGYAAFTLATNATVMWGPAHFIRVFHAPIGEVGVTLGLFQIVGLSTGLISAGFWIDRNVNLRPDSAMRFSVIGASIALPFMLAFPYMPNLPLGMLVITLASSIGGAGYGVSTVGLQQMMPNQMRGQAAAMYLVVSNLVGGTLGPFLVATLNKLVFHDPAKIGVSASIIGGLGLTLAIIMLGSCLRHFRGAIDAVDRSTVEAGAASVSVKPGGG